MTLGLVEDGADHRDAVLLRHRRGRQAVGRSDFAEDARPPVLVDEFGDHGLRFLGLALIVFDDDADLLAEHAAAGVDGVDGHVDALLGARPKVAVAPVSEPYSPMTISLSSADAAFLLQAASRRPGRCQLRKQELAERFHVLMQHEAPLLGVWRNVISAVTGCNPDRLRVKDKILPSGSEIGRPNRDSYFNWRIVTGGRP